ncbi:trypsin-like peptidase domain-containing protein [Acidobacteriota bacterium]
MSNSERLIAVVFCVLILSSAVSAEEVQPQSKGDVSFAALSSSLEEMVDRITPAVVQVFTTGYSPLASAGATGGDLLHQRYGSGSGVIIDPDGYIVTNAHVIFAARRIQVQMATPKKIPSKKSILRPRGKMFDAEVIGMDKETDIAVLKIQGRGLPHIDLGDSDDLRPGQLVLAFGSPRGLRNSVSMGVVSAVARQMRPEDPVVFIQTDAAINPGNSGGPLVSALGNVVGINTFIISRSGGDEGIGFAVPSNIVANVFRQIRERGYVQRGIIGTYSQTITAPMAEGLGLSQDWGVILGDVYSGGPADQAGLKIGDIVRRLNGKIMENGRQFDVNLYSQSIGEEVEIEIMRGGERITVKVLVDERPNDPARFVDLVQPERNRVPELGILCLDIDRRIAAMLPPLRKDGRVVVAAISQDSLFSEAKFEPGDIIYSVNDNPITSLVGLKAIMSIMKEGEAVVFQIERDRKLRFLSIEL